MKDIIKSGYMISVDSSENDADCYRNITIDGISENKARFYYDILKLFLTTVYDDPRGLSNILSDEQEYYDKLIYQLSYPIFTKHKQALCEYFLIDEIHIAEYDDENIDPDDPHAETMYGRHIIETCLEIAENFTGSSEEYLTRVVDDIKIYYIPEQIVLQEVSFE